MTAETVLAIIGLSAGVGSFVGASIATWWFNRVPTGHKQLVRRVYVHVDELIGATKTENQIRAGKRFAAMQPFWRGGLGRNLGRKWADAWWPVPQFGGTSARPTTKRMVAYVRLEFRWQRPWWGLWRQYRIWDIEAVTVFWTSEAAALVGEFPKNVGRKIAQAWRLENVDQLVWNVDYDRGSIRYTTKPAVVEDLPDRPPMDVRTSV